MKSADMNKEWIYEDLLSLPSEESGVYEYKSSKTKMDELKNKISVAASAFWNSGGGIFIAGINDKDGKIDGGIPKYVGRQNIRDWVDKVIKHTEPLGEYQVFVIEHSDLTREIEEEKAVLIINFNKSSLVPHMAYDKKYYIRAGAHSEAATHFQVEALHALRRFSKPSIRGVMKYHPTKPKIEELVIVSLNDAVALDISLTFDPFPLWLEEHFKDDFPLEIPVIDKNNPFRMEISGFGFRREAFGDEPIKLILAYKDILGNQYKSEQHISPQKNLQPMAIGEDVREKLIKVIERLAKSLER